MKKTAIYYFSLAALAAGSLVSCQDEDQGFDYDTVHDSVVAREYYGNFVARYGSIDPTHNWGFGSLPVSSNYATRANVANKNEWETVYNMQVPGWPDTYVDINGQLKNNGFHYVNTGHTGEGYYPANSNPRPGLDQTGILPAGDVTDEEIQYVSWWFRTHQPVKIPIHCTDFYIQEISSDNDRNNSDGTVITAINIEDKQSDGTFVPNGKTSSDKVWGLEKMIAQTFNGETDSEAGSGNDGYDHIKNFNQNASNNLAKQEKVYCGTSDTTQIWNNDVYTIGDTPIRLIEFFTSSGTENFKVLCSQDSQWKDHYTLVHLQFYGPSGRFYDGYYLGFDYECNKVTSDGNSREYRGYDGYYSNWIVKLTPAVPFESPVTRRIMCEDLGNTFDFDFNDVVFDVTMVSSNDAIVTLRAAGGTLPIYVGFNPQLDGNADKYEAHHLMGQSTSSVPINVGAPGVSGPISTYHVKNLNSSDPGDIQIYVNNNGHVYSIKTPVKSGALDDYNDGDRTQPNDLKYAVAPQKFAVPIGVRWMKECKFIEDGYPKFNDWVNDHTKRFNGKSWYHNDNITTDATKKTYIYDSGESGISGDEPAPYSLKVNNGNGQEMNQIDSYSWPWFNDAIANNCSSIVIVFNQISSVVNTKLIINSDNNNPELIEIPANSTSFEYSIAGKSSITSVIIQFDPKITIKEVQMR